MKPSRPVVLVLVALAVVVTVWIVVGIRSSATTAHVATEIRALLRGPSPGSDSAEVFAEKTWARVAAFYRPRHEHPVWSHGGSLSPQALRLIATLSDLEGDGLDPALYRRDALALRVRRLERQGPIEAAQQARLLAEADIRLTYAFLLAAQHLTHGRVPLQALDRDWLADSTRSDPAKVLDSAIRHDQIRQALIGLEPTRPEYLRLRAALARYRKVRSEGGWRRVPGADLKSGERGEAVAALRRRLAIGEGWEAGAEGDLFDRPLGRALRGYQERQGLDPSGRLDAPTRRALDVPVEDRIRQIELNLERWRWLPRAFVEPRVEVNIPDFTLAVWDSGRVNLGMKVVVGQVEKQTPIFSDEISYLELNPAWRLSKRILVKEILPEIEKNLDYLNQHQMIVTYFGGKDTLTVDASAVDWSRAEDPEFKYLVTQLPGPENPLGCVKIMCPNEYDVYLHDTPARGAFGARRRALSHGCVRLEHPLDLARYVLAEQPERDSLETLIATGMNRKIGLKKKVPISVLYWTAWADSAERLHFRDDLYGLDRRLARALRGDSLAFFRINLPAADSLSYP